MALYEKQKDVHSRQEHQPQQQIGCSRVGLTQHIVGDLHGKYLQQHPVAAGQLRHIGCAGAIGIGVGEAGGAAGGERIGENNHGFPVCTIIPIQCFQNVFRLFFLRTGDYGSIRQAKIGVSGFPKVRGSDHVTHLLLPIASGKNADHFSIQPQRSIENYQILAADASVNNHVHSGIAIHAVLEISPVSHIGLQAPVIRVNSLGIHIADVVKNRGLCQFFQHFHIGLLRVHRPFIHIGDGTDTVLGTCQQIIYAFGCLGSCVCDIFGISLHRYITGFLQIDKKTCKNQTK